MMSTVAEPLDQAASAIDSLPAESLDRYQRLDLLDRHSAESLQQYCRVSTRLNHSATRLSNAALLQSVATSIPLACADFVSLYASIFLTTAVVERVLGVATTQIESQTAFFMALVILPIAHLAGLYPGLGLGSIVEFRQLARGLFASAIVYAGIGWFCFPGSWVFYAASAGLVFAVALPLTMTMRFFTQHMAKYLPIWGAPTLIVAEPKRALELYKRLSARTEQGFRPVGVLLDGEQAFDGRDFLELNNVPVFDIHEADQVAVRQRATWVLISPCSNREQSPSLDPTLAAIPNRVLLASNQLDLGIWDEPMRMGDSSCLRVGGGRANSLALALKRVLDITLTSLAVLAGLPVLLTICFFIRLSSRGPIFYGQERIGYGGKKFKAWKFRSMQMDADQVLEDYLDSHPEARREWDEKHKLENDPRVTEIGKLLRLTSLDEIPQLWNVLRGEMSLVGPRPIVDSPTYDASYIRDYPDEFEAYKSVTPGLTGLWQVRCRNSGVYDLRIYWDMYYIRNWNIWLDLYLIMRTVKTVILREGAY